MAATGHFLTPNIVRLEMLANGEIIGPASGFLIRYHATWFVVTNWHVLSGRNPATGQPLHRMGAVPSQCRFNVISRDGAADELRWTTHTFDLGDLAAGTANWRQHPRAGQDVDIAVLPLEDGQQGLAKDLLEEGAHDPHFWIDLGDELFLPGFPLGIAVAGAMPIWKRASLATSPEFQNGPTFLVDTASREGMSGSPCLALSNWRYYRKDPETLKMKVIERPISWRLLGVYSGRLDPGDGLGAQLGIVWRDVVLTEVLAGGVPATVEIRAPASQTPKPTA